MLFESLKQRCPNFRLWVLRMYSVCYNSFADATDELTPIGLKLYPIRERLIRVAWAQGLA